MVNKMEKEVYQGSIDAMVNLIDWTPINEAISKTVGFDVECRLGNGYFPSVKGIFDKDLNVEETRSIIIDNECCGATSKVKNMYISDIKENGFTASLFRGVGFFKVSKENEEGKRSIAMFPSFYFDIDEDDVKKCLTDELIPLYMFMKTRYAYNPRIRGNEMETLRLLYHVEDVLDEKLGGKGGWQTRVQKSWKVA